MKFRIGLALAAALIAVVPLFTACNKEAAPSGPTTGTSGGGGGGGDKQMTVGFAQTGSESGWRNANTKSVKEEAAKRKIDLKFVDANSDPQKQQKALADFIAQRVDIIILEPIQVQGWDSVLKEAKSANIPVIIGDRNVAAPADLYVTFIGSDFLDEGRKAGEWLAKKTGGKAVIAEMQGEVGSAPARDRKKGFEEAIAKFPEMKIVLSQTADFKRAKGNELMATYMQDAKFKDVTVLYAHNDDMALGAIEAIKAGGKKPGKDLMIVSVDGTKDGIAALRAGEINCIVECNPLLGPQLFDNASKILKGESVPKEQKSIESVYDQDGLDFGRPEKAVKISDSKVEGF
ncbi:MAG TPA: ABC transporter substrate-binding protein [Phycisphaerae bacterium]|jgi:simple sugar transport system substrate-binding protein|nr:ABC transporter substrate-binding protein [Phycisphaerae bacterium]